MNSQRILVALALLMPLCACKVGPNYSRPSLDVPGQYRGVAPTAGGQGEAQPSLPAPTPQPSDQPVALPQGPSHPQTAAQPGTAGQPFGDMTWSAVFQDEVLQGLIKEALTNNYDMRIAATRIMEANANLGIVRANQFPTLSGNASITNERNFQFPGSPTFGTLGLTFNYILDFWGQYRRATEAARAQLLATEYGRSVVETSLVASVASDYYLLRQYDAQLEYSNATVAADTEILKLNNIRFKGGEAAISEVYQAQVLVQAAEASVIQYQQLIEQTETNLSILLGRNPGPIARGLNLVDQPHLADIPEGLPSDLLRRRPDVRQAEENLVAANANVGVAKAAFFPQFSITGAFGAQSLALDKFLAGPGTFWAVGAGAVQPLFQGGRIRSGYKLAQAQRDDAELQYKQTVQRAFGDVSNSLVGYTQARQFRMKLQEQTNTYEETVRLANVRFRGGVTSFLEVQYNEQQYFQSALLLSQAWYSEMQYYVSLYQALGGGWQVQ